MLSIGQYTHTIMSVHFACLNRCCMSSTWFVFAACFNILFITCTVIQINHKLSMHMFCLEVASLKSGNYPTEFNYEVSSVWSQGIIISLVWPTPYPKSVGVVPFPRKQYFECTTYGVWLYQSHHGFLDRRSHWYDLMFITVFEKVIFL